MHNSSNVRVPNHSQFPSQHRRLCLCFPISGGVTYTKLLSWQYSLISTPTRHHFNTNKAPLVLDIEITARFYWKIVQHDLAYVAFTPFAVTFCPSVQEIEPSTSKLLPRSPWTSLPRPPSLPGNYHPMVDHCFPWNWASSVSGHYLRRSNLQLASL